jgi:hypothetical protein
MPKTNFANGSQFHPHHADKIWGGEGTYPLISPVDDDGHIALLGATVGDIRAYGADPLGSADSTAAIQACLAACDVAIVPAGNFRIASGLLISDGQSLLGLGANSIISTTSEISMVEIANGAAVKIDGVHLRGNGGGNQDGIVTYQTGGAVDIHVSRCRFYDLHGSALLLSDSQNASRVFIDNCKIDGGNIGVNAGGATATTSPRIIARALAITGCIVPVFARGRSVPTIIADSQIVGGRIEFSYSEKVMLSRCVLDVAEFRFHGCDACVIADCWSPGDQANAVNNNYGGAGSFVQWERCRDASGRLASFDSTIADTRLANLRGGYCKVSLNSNLTIPANTFATLFVTGTSDGTAISESSNNDSHTAHAFFDGSTGRIYCRGLGGGLVTVRVSVSFNYNAQSDMECWLLKNGAKQFAAPGRLTASNGFYEVSWLYNIEASDGDYFSIEIDNESATDSGDVWAGAFVEFEGL